MDYGRSKMEDVEIVSRAGGDRWNDVVRLTTETEHWILTVDDLELWERTFGRENVNLWVAVDKRSGQTLASFLSLFYESVEGSEPLVLVTAFYVVQERRGTQLGRVLFQKGMAESRFAGLNFGMLGVETMTEKYAQRSGFDKYQEWNLPIYALMVADLQLPESVDVQLQLQCATEVDFVRIAAYAKSIHDGVHRVKYLEELIAAKNFRAQVAVDSAGNVVGFAGIKTICSERLQLTPWYADSEAVATDLLVGLLQTFPNFASYKSLIIFGTSHKKTFNEKLFSKLSNDRCQLIASIYPQFTDHALKVNKIKLFAATDDSIA